MPLKNIVFILLLLYCILLLFMYFQQHNFLFFPHWGRHQNHDKNVEEYSYDNKGITLRGWLVAPDNIKSNLLIYYGGNAENIFFSISEFTGYSDFSSLLVNYRGYGSSDGRPSEAGLIEDALAVYDTIQKRHRPKRVFLMGRSLGSGVAVQVAAKRKVDGIILITPYDSIESLARNRYPFLPVSLLLKHKFKSTDYTADIDCPTLVVYGGRDNVIANKSTLKLIETLPKKKVVLINEAGHNDIGSYLTYNTAVSTFLKNTQ